jgi:DHA1 family bicyclomycin/chloramphenicol resistance-like MFS transporter
VLLVALTSLGELSTQLLLPSLGAIEADLGAGSGSIHLGLGAFVAAFGLGQLLLGPLSDRVGRRPVLMTGLVLHLVATLTLLSTDSIAEFTILRAIQGFGACAAYALARAIVRDVWQENAAPALSLMMFGTMLTVAFAPVLGGLIATFLGGWKAALGAVLAIAAMTSLATLVRYRESNTLRDPAAGRLSTLVTGYRDLLSGSSFRAFALALACAYGAMFAFIAGSSFVFTEQLGQTKTAYGLLFGLIISGLVIGTLVAKNLAPRLGPQRVVGVGSTLMAMGALGGTVIHQVPGLELIGIVGPQIVVTLGGGLVLPATLAGAVLPNPHRAGMAAGFMGFAQMAGASLAGLTLSLVQDDTALPMLGVQASFALLGFLLFRITLRPGRAIPSPTAP